MDTIHSKTIFLAVVTVTPLKTLISTLGGMAEFGCTISPSAGVLTVQWLANERSLDDLYRIEFNSYYLDRGFGRITFMNLPSRFNMTRVACRAIYDDGHRENSTSFTVCLLQG